MLRITTTACQRWQRSQNVRVNRFVERFCFLPYYLGTSALYQYRYEVTRVSSLPPTRRFWRQAEFHQRCQRISINASLCTTYCCMSTVVVVFSTMCIIFIPLVSLFHSSSGLTARAMVYIRPLTAYLHNNKPSGRKCTGGPFGYK